MKRILIIVMCLWGSVLYCQTNAKPAIRIGMDHPFSSTLNKNDNQNSIDCTAHQNFHNGLCRMKGNQAFINYLTKAMGQPVEIINFEDRPQLLQEFYKGNIDFMFFHLNNFEEALHTHGKITKPLLTALERIDAKSPETAYYYSNFIVKKNSTIKSVNDLRGKRIGMRCYSTSGSEIPYMLLKDRHIDPSKETQLNYYPSSMAQVDAFLKNEVDAIVIWSYFFEHYRHNVQIEPNDFRIIEQYKIPDRVFVANNQKTTRKIQHKFVNAMLKMPKQSYKGLSFSGVTSYQESDYKVVLSLLEQYRQLHIQPRACDQMIIDKKPRVWHANL